MLIDEAQHFSRIATGRRLQDQLDTLKSLSNMTGTLLVLFGSYELHHFRNLSGQLSRRSIDVHFPRYDIRVQDDVEAFRNLLFTFQGELPLAEEPDLDARWDYFYERSLGCAGVLKDWLKRAYEDAQHAGASERPLVEVVPARVEGLAQAGLRRRSQAWREASHRRPDRK